MIFWMGFLSGMCIMFAIDSLLLIRASRKARYVPVHINTTDELWHDGSGFIMLNSPPNERIR